MRITLLLSLICICMPLTSQAGEVKSFYTNIDLGKCKLAADAKPGNGEWSEWHCRGFRGMRVTVVESDLRFYLSYGPKGKKQQVTEQTLPPFNNIGAKLEWRAKKRRGRWVPYATILRYFTDTGDGQKGQILVVTKLGKDDACHVAYIDALANKNANALARRTADQRVPSFLCRADEPQRVGNQGVSPL